jgi:hypothetical protein
MVTSIASGIRNLCFLQLLLVAWLFNPVSGQLACSGGKTALCCASTFDGVGGDCK